MTETRGSRVHRRRSLRGAVSRNRSRWMIRTALVVSAMAWIGLTVGLVYGGYAALGGVVGPDGLTSMPSAAAPQSKATKTIRIMALGDSLAHGYGDVSGEGFVGDVAKAYQSAGFHVSQVNLGIDGLTSEGLNREMQKKAVSDLVATTDVAIVSVGGNDLTDAAGLPAINKIRIRRAKQVFAANLAHVLSQLTKENPHLTIVLVGLYNPYSAVPSVQSETNAIVASWCSVETNLASHYPRTVLVPVFDLFQINPTELLYLDHFHPNQQGYQRIAKRIWQDLMPGIVSNTFERTS